VGIGDKVNLAARLMGKAKGGILLDYGTYALIPVEIRVNSLLSAGIMAFKGNK
jgi:class 3 adenylate cyclase